MINQIILKLHCILVRETDPLTPHQTGTIRANTPLSDLLSSCPIGRAATPASRRLLMLMLPRLSTRGSPIRSFSDSARSRWDAVVVSPSDARLKMARRPRMEGERVGTAAKSFTRNFTHADGECEDDMAPRDATFGSGEEDLACWDMPFRRAVSMPRGVVEVVCGKLVASSLPFK